MAMISVFIPIYNGERYLARTLDSVLGQSYRDLEVLCVDDSSTDSSNSILQNYVLRDSRIRVFLKPNGGSVPPSWEYIIPYIKGEFVLYMSQDDLLEPNTIELMVQRQKETNAEAVMPHEIHYVEGLPMEKMHHLKGIKSDVAPVILGKDAFRLMIDYSISGRALWAASVIRQNGIRTDTFNADELAQREWVSCCKRVAFSEAVFIYYRGNAQSITEHHSSLHYESILTDAELLLFAEKKLVGETALLNEMANRYYLQLYKLMILYLQHKSQYSKVERNRIKPFLRKAYQILHTRETLPNWKYRLSKKSFHMMRIVALFKKTQYAYRRIDVINDLDMRPIQTPRKYLQ